MLFAGGFYRFNSQPPEGGWLNNIGINAALVCFNSQTPEGGWVEVVTNGKTQKLFQLTAARRRLGFNV